MTRFTDMPEAQPLIPVLEKMGKLIQEKFHTTVNEYFNENLKNDDLQIDFSFMPFAPLCELITKNIITMSVQAYIDTSKEPDYRKIAKALTVFVGMSLRDKEIGALVAEAMKLTKK